MTKVIQGAPPANEEERLQSRIRFLETDLKALTADKRALDAQYRELHGKYLKLLNDHSELQFRMEQLEK